MILPLTPDNVDFIVQTLLFKLYCSDFIVQLAAWMWVVNYEPRELQVDHLNSKTTRSRSLQLL